tara:strand:+ start:1158 stop:1415 length:258 start_codon:yes stop_codon:yes gene_type:complete
MLPTQGYGTGHAIATQGYGASTGITEGALSILFVLMNIPSMGWTMPEIPDTDFSIENETGLTPEIEDETSIVWDFIVPDIDWELL